MDIKILRRYSFITTSFLVIIPLYSIPLAIASPKFPCKLGDTQSDLYILRDNNRCEGIKRQIDLSSTVELISFATRNISNTNFLNIKVPRLKNSPRPSVFIQERTSRYKLDHISLEATPKFYKASISAKVLNRRNVERNRIRGFARIRDSGIYLPVILGNSGRKYEFVFFANGSIAFLSLQIKEGNKVIRKIWDRPNSNFYQDGEISFTWDGKDQLGKTVDTGRYTLLYSVKREARGKRPALTTSKEILFEHNPNWLN